MFCCRTVRLANYLLKNGCLMIRIDHLQANPKFLVFMFKWDDTLSAALETWKTDKDSFIC